MANNTVDHMAGIIPIFGRELSIGMPWHDALTPVAPDYFAIERAVTECASAGCDTIWIVGNYDVNPVLKKRIGEVVKDPSFSYGSALFKDCKLIPVFYLLIDELADKKQNCLSRSLLYGAEVSMEVSKTISKWAQPTRFYASFVNAVALEEELRKSRKLIKGPKDLYFTKNDQSICDGIFINFTFNKAHFAEYKKRYLDLANDVRTIRVTDLITPKEIFCALDNDPHDRLELSQQFDIATWDGYCEYMGSPLSRQIKKNKSIFTKYKRKSFVQRIELYEEYTKPQYSDGRKNGKNR